MPIAPPCSGAVQLSRPSFTQSVESQRVGAEVSCALGDTRLVWCKALPDRPKDLLIRDPAHPPIRSRRVRVLSAPHDLVDRRLGRSPRLTSSALQPQSTS